MGRVKRIRYLLALVGISIIAYLAYLGVLRQIYLGAFLGFTAGFMLDASTREKSIVDNISLGLALAGILAYADFYLSLTNLVTEKLGTGFILAMVALAGIALLGSIFDEIRVGRTARIPIAPTALFVISVLVLYSAVSVDTAAVSVRSSEFADAGSDFVKRVNDTYSTIQYYTPSPLLNGTKAFSAASPIANSSVAYIGLAIRDNGTDFVRRAGNLTGNFTLSPIPTDLSKIELRLYKGGSLYHVISADNITYTNGTGTFLFKLDSIDVYYLNTADRVALVIDPIDTPASSVSATIHISLVGERVLNKSYAYIALVLEGLAALLALPEGTARRVRRIGRRRRR